MSVSFKKCSKEEWKESPYYTISSNGILLGEIFFYDGDTDPTIQIDGDLSTEDLTTIINMTTKFYDEVYKENIGPEN